MGKAETDSRKYAREGETGKRGLCRRRGMGEASSKVQGLPWCLRFEGSEGARGEGCKKIEGRDEMGSE